jgi:hypothetical protein
MSKKFVRRQQNIRFRSGSVLLRSVVSLAAAKAKLRRRGTSIGRSGVRLEAASRSLPNPTILCTELGPPVALVEGSLPVRLKTERCRLTDFKEMKAA